MVAALARCAYYLDRFADPKIDPHHDLCVDTFGEPYLKADKDGKKKLRRSVKELTYSSLYGAGDETKWEIVTSAEDDKTETLLFPDFTLREVQAFSRNWHRRCPEIAVWWEATIAEWSKQGYLAEPVMGGRCQFLDGEDPNKMLNFKPQSGGAALAWHAYFRAEERLEKEVPSARFIHQGYDSLMFECKQEDGEKVKTILEETMIEDGSRYGLPIRFVGEAQLGPTWKDV
jgi:DNA polymerase I-like protein with 3'-5' exonuclease and polymerase domains